VLNCIIICDKYTERRINFVNSQLIIVAMEMILTIRNSSVCVCVAFLLLITEMIFLDKCTASSSRR